MEWSHEPRFLIEVQEVAVVAVGARETHGR
jgi:creatinine amidohydrolase/Fe(II)-dependent formamide hydrolase-like protein